MAYPSFLSQSNSHDEEMFEHVVIEKTQSEAAEGLLRLRETYYGSTTVGAINRSSSSTTIHPLEPIPHRHLCQLPSIANLLLPIFNNTPSSFDQHCNNSRNSRLSWASSSKILYSPGAATYSYSQDTSSSVTLVEPLPSSYSSLGKSIKRPQSLKMVSSKKKETFLSRAVTFTRRRGRPRKNTLPSTETVAFDDASSVNTSDPFNITTPTIKARWQEAEKQELIEAIVKEKHLDDMKSIRWDRISMTVGRAKKACKDQWRRVLLPDLLKRPNGNDKIKGKNRHYAE